MNPFEHIKELRSLLKTEVKEKNINKFNTEPTITEAEHYSRMLNLLAIIEKDLESAEYNYKIELNGHSKVHTFKEMSFLQSNLNDDVILFQPISEDVLSNTDMKSLADILSKLRDTEQIKQNMIILPPGINVFKAVLVKPSEEQDDNKPLEL